MTSRFNNQELYKHLKAATKEASDLLHNIKSARISPQEDSIDNILAKEPSFELCIQYLTDNPLTEKLKTIQEPEKRKKEARKFLLLLIKKYLGCPYITFIAVI